jgi:hypothetical protein
VADPTTLYIKRGRRYHPHRHLIGEAAFPPGSHLITIARTPTGSWTAYRYDVAPATAPVLAADVLAEEVVCGALNAALFHRDVEPPQPLTPKAQQLLRELSAEMGPTHTFRGLSLVEISERVVKALREAANAR